VEERGTGGQKSFCMSMTRSAEVDGSMVVMVDDGDEVDPRHKKAI